MRTQNNKKRRERRDIKPLVETTFCGFHQVSQTPDKLSHGRGRRFESVNARDGGTRRRVRPLLGSMML